jgi:predicted nuclease of predicted toxin-antitoxin system
LAAAVRLYLDENLSPVIAEQLRLRGIDAVSVRDLGHLGKSDEFHLEQATAQGRVLVTSDIDFLQMVSEGVEHPGVVFGDQQSNTIGNWVKGLALICFVLTPDDMKNHVEYL